MNINNVVSINILNYNTYSNSCICIDSCLRQVGIWFRILLIDNASIDDSFSRLKAKYGNKIDYLQNGANFGFAKGNNLGVKFCYDEGFKYSLLLNSDTELVGYTVLKEIVEIAENHLECAVVAPTVYDVTWEGLVLHTNDYRYLKMLRKYNILPQNKIITKDIETVSEAHGSALLVENSIFLDVHGFPEHYFMYCEESTFAKKILWAGKEILWYKSINNYILHHHDKSGIVDSWRLILMGRNIALEYYENCNNHSLIWGVLYRILFLKNYIKGVWTKCPFIYIGMKDGRRLHQTKASSDVCFKNGVEIRNKYINYES